jgi:hypothetical protein
MRKILPVVVAVVLIAAIVGFQYFGRAAKARSSDARPPAERDELAEMKREVGALRGEVRATALHTQLGNFALQQAPGSEPAASGQAVEAEPPLSPEESELRREEQMTRIASSFQAEVRNPDWSRKVEGEIAAAMKDDKIRLTAKSVDCRSKSCRIELEQGDPAAQGKGMPLLANHLAASLPDGMSHEESDGHGGSNTVFYFFRDGIPSFP